MISIKFDHQRLTVSIYYLHYGTRGTITNRHLGTFSLLLMHVKYHGISILESSNLINQDRTKIIWSANSGLKRKRREHDYIQGSAVLRIRIQIFLSDPEFFLSDLAWDFLKNTFFT
jgi:hypothetical protein